MKYRQRLGPPPATMNRLLAEPASGPWVNCPGVEVLRGRFVGGRIIKVWSGKIFFKEWRQGRGIYFLFEDHV
jgi:hypothetical protein